MIRCCKDCVPPKRHLACWSDCPDYIKEKAEDARKKAEYEREHLAETYRYAMLKEHFNYIVERQQNSHGISYFKKQR